MFPIGGGLAIGLAASLAILALTSGPGPGPAASSRPTPSSAAPPAGRTAVAYTYPEAREAPPLDLVDQDERPFSLAALRGSPVLVYFGYTHCPDVCPATVATINDALAATTAADVRVVLVTVDPERDDAAALREYLRYLPDAYLALTGSAGAIREAATGYGVTYARVDTGSASGYAMAHTAEIYLIDRAGLLRAHYPFGVPAEALVRDLDLLTPG